MRGVGGQHWSGQHFYRCCRNACCIFGGPRKLNWQLYINRYPHSQRQLGREWERVSHTCTVTTTLHTTPSTLNPPPLPATPAHCALFAFGFSLSQPTAARQLQALALHLPRDRSTVHRAHKRERERKERGDRGTGCSKRYP